MSEYQDPPLRLSIEALRWMGDEWESTGEIPAPFDLWSTDSDSDSAAILRLLRRAASQRLHLSLLALAAGHGALEFDSPNAPTESDLDELVQHATHVLENLRVLKQLAPEVLDDEAEASHDR
jgi:hypothetical protein